MQRQVKYVGMPSKYLLFVEDSKYYSPSFNQL